MISYLIAAFSSVLSNVICVYFVKSGYIVLKEGQLIMDIFLHINIINMFLFIILFSVQKIRGKAPFGVIDSFRGKQEVAQFLLFFFPVIASVYKTYLLGFIPVTTITICSMVVPFTVWLLAIFLLKETLKSQYIKYGMLSVFGFLLVNIQKLSNGKFSLDISTLLYLVSYVFIVSFGQITMRYYCRKRDHTLQAVMAEIMIFFIYAIIFLTIRGTFSLNLLLNPFVLCVSLCCFMRHVLIINGVRKASSVVALEFCGFSKPIFACILAFILLGELPQPIKVVGMSIIIFSIIKFYILERVNKQKLKAVGLKLFDEKIINKIKEDNQKTGNIVN